MGLKIFTKALSSSLHTYPADLKVLEAEIGAWQKQQPETLRNVVIAQSHTNTEIIVIVWYDD